MCKGQGYLPLPKVERTLGGAVQGPRKGRGGCVQWERGTVRDGTPSRDGPFHRRCPALPHPAESQFGVSHHVLSR